MSASKRGYTNQVNTGAVEFFSHNFKNFLQPYGKAYIQLNDRIIKHGLAYSTFSNSIYQNFEDIQDKLTQITPDHLTKKNWNDQWTKRKLGQKFIMKRKSFIVPNGSKLNT